MTGDSLTIRGLRLSLQVWHFKNSYLICYIFYQKWNWLTSYILPESLTNIFLDGDACPASVINLTSSSVEAVTDALRDGHMDSCLEPKTLAQNHLRILIPSTGTLHRIRVLSRGTNSCSPLNGITMYGVAGCYGEVPCEIRMCVAREQMEQSNGLLCSFTCSGYNYRYALMSISHNAFHHKICEIQFHWFFFSSAALTVNTSCNNKVYYWCHIFRSSKEIAIKA